MSFFGGRRQQPETLLPEKPTDQLSAPMPVGFETVLGANATMKGDLRSEANVRLDGVFEGTLEIEGNVLVGETANITADINARNISIAGAVRGNINGVKVQILRTGRVWGDINVGSITTEDGAFIDGRVTMVEHEALEDFETPSLPAPELEEVEFVADIEAEEGEILDDETPFEESSSDDEHGEDEEEVFELD